MICIKEATVFEGNPNIKTYELDVTSLESIDKAKEAILNDYKSIDVVVNNAGVGYRSFVELSEDDKIDAIVNKRRRKVAHAWSDGNINRANRSTFKRKR